MKKSRPASGALLASDLLDWRFCEPCVVLLDIDKGVVSNSQRPHVVGNMIAFARIGHASQGMMC